MLKDITPEILNTRSENTMVSHLGIEITEVGEDFLAGKMPVDNRTCRTMGILHGGASVVLAETLGSIAATFFIDRKTQYCAGIEINANHIRQVAVDNYVYGIAKPLHIGKKTQVWEIKITNEKQKLVCISRLTVANLDKPEK